MKKIYNDLIIKYRHFPAPDTYEELCKADLKLLKESDDTAWYFNLSPERLNILESFPWNKDMEVLQLSVCTAIFAPLSMRVKSWTFYGADKEKKEFISLRFPRLVRENKLLFIDSETDFQGKKYDIVVISLIDEPDEDIERTLSELSKKLKPAGSILIICDNANALKYMVGAKPPTPGSALDKKALNALKKRLKFKGIKLYYPLPDAAFSKSVFCDERLPAPSDFKGISESPYESRFIFCREENLYTKINDAGAFSNLCPAYLCILSNDDSLLERLPSYVKYNSMRSPKYALKTELLGGKVIKTALSRAANNHVSGFKNRRDLLKKEALGRYSLAEVSVGTDEYGRSFATFPYIEGMDLGRILTLFIEGGAAPKDELYQAIDLILGPEGTKCHNLDALFENLIQRSDGEYVLIDYEWVSEEALDRDFLSYRMLRYWYDAHSGVLTKYQDAPAFFQDMGVSKELLAQYEEQELDFQNTIRGELKDIEDSFKKDQKYVWDIQDALNQVSSQDIEIKELKSTISKEREVERLSQNHIRNIEAINKIQKDELEALNRDIDYLKKHQSLSSKVIRKAVGWLDAFAPQGSGRRAFIHLIKRIIRRPLATIRALLNGEERVLILGEMEIGESFIEGGVLKVPQILDVSGSDYESLDKGTAESRGPAVSVIIPVYDQIAYTYSCIRSIIENIDFDACPYEIILADDASKDATEHISRYIKGLRISRNPSNRGFLKNCNEAAKKAQGKYIFFLNNDTVVHKGTLETLASLLESDESIGMTGSKLIYPDGRLQEAGGIIWSDASGWNYGRLDDPQKPEYNYVKEVDYISGAAIMIRKKLWDEIGGFDERYAPAYCEDSDLAFEVRRHGKRVVYQPESVVTHFEGISNGTDLEGSGLKHYQKVNSEKFKEKWADELKNHAPNTGDPNPFCARDLSLHKPCVVVIDHYVPTWDQDAGSRTTYQYLKMFLKKGFNVKFIGDNFFLSEPYTSILQQMGIEVLYGTWYQNNIREWFKKNASFIQFCYLNRPHVAVKYIDFLKKETDIKCIFYGHDLHFLRLHREYELSADTAKLKESEYWKTIELSVMDQADMVYYPSEAEIDVIRSLRPGIHARAIRAYLWDDIPERHYSAADFDTREGLLFVGGFHHPPNADGVKWFAREVFPKIRHERPDISFYVVGSGANEDKELMELAGGETGIEILGRVSDERLSRLYASARVIVVPLRYGAGVKGKVIEALYNGSAIVTTEIGAEGIPEAHNVMVVAKDYSESFSKEIISLYEDTGRCAMLAGKSIDYIKKYFSLDAAWNIIEEDFR